MNILRSPSLHGRLSLVLTTLIAVMMLIGAGVWLRETRLAIHEEVEAATRVAEQWLKVLVPETLADGPQARERLMDHLGAIGRIRANRLEVFAADGQRLYVSPESPYKAGRHAPEWFAGWVAPEVAERRLEANGLAVVLTPDTSRAVLDAWDHVGAALGWALALLLAIWLATRFAIDRALAPITEIHTALERGASGRFDQRLPEYATASSRSRAQLQPPRRQPRREPRRERPPRAGPGPGARTAGPARAGAARDRTRTARRARPGHHRGTLDRRAPSSSAPPPSPASTAARRPSWR
jgi:hypothetical protein